MTRFRTIASYHLAATALGLFALAAAAQPAPATPTPATTPATAPAPSPAATAPTAQPPAAPVGAATTPAPEAAMPPAPAPEPMLPAATEMPAAALPPEPPPPPAADTQAPAPIAIHAWGRVGMRLQDPKKPKNLGHLGQDGDLELHFDGNATKEIGVTGNVAAVFGSGDIQGTVQILDLIARFDLDDAFHVWGGRMLVPSDRANFSGTWFEAPWYYPGTFALAGGHGFMGPHEGPYGRNDGVTVWGQAEGGLFKYYASAFDLYDPTKKPLWSGRLNLSLLNPEPGYYHSSTYYGKDILAIGVGGQVQKNGSINTPMTTMATPMPKAMIDDYALFNADILFEKNLHESGVLDLEGAFYKYVGNYEPFKYSFLALASWLTPEKVGPGKIQPLVRFQQGKTRLMDQTDSSVEAQIGYVIAEYGARLALGYQYTKVGGQSGNGIYLGAQILK